MSSPDRRRLRRLALLAVMTLPLAGCLQPMYADRSVIAASGGTTVQPGVADMLAAVDVAVIETRLGQQIRNQLIFRLTRGAAAPPARFRLSVANNEVVQNPVIDPRSARPEVDSVSVDAVFALFVAGGGGELMRGRGLARASYQRSRQRFAVVRAQRDAENRAAEQVAEQIYVQLASYFASTPAATIEAVIAKTPPTAKPVPVAR